jgi:ribonuclease HI
VQHVPIYFISEALASSKKYYSEMEKICYDIVMSTRKLQHYFEAHRIRVLTNEPVKNIFRNHDSSGRVGKWAMDLSEHVIDFEKRSAKKSQVLAYFIADWMEPSNCTEGGPADTPWLVYCDGAWGASGVGAAAILKSPSGIKLRSAARLQFKAKTEKCSNNIAEYEAVLLGLHKLRVVGVQCCTLKTDSKIISQIEKECIVWDETLERYLHVVRRMDTFFKGFTLKHIERPKKTKADELAKVAARKAELPPDVFFQVIKDPSVKTVEPEPRMINIVQGEDWRAQILAYLHHHYEPNSTAELNRMQQRVKAYQIIEDDLYKTSATRPLFCCVSKSEGKELLAQIHSCLCGGHIGARALMAKVFRQGFYWPSLFNNASKLVKTC